MHLDKKTVAILKSMFAVDADGKTYMRVVATENVEGLKSALKSQSTRKLETLLGNAIVLDEDKKPALNLAIVPFKISVMDNEKERTAGMRDNLAKVQKAEAKKHKSAPKAKK